MKLINKCNKNVFSQMYVQMYSTNKLAGGPS